MTRLSLGPNNPSEAPSGPIPEDRRSRKSTRPLLPGRRFKLVAGIYALAPTDLGTVRVDAVLWLGDDNAA